VSLGRGASTRRVPFAVPTATGAEARAIDVALADGNWASGGPNTRAVERELERAFETAHARLVCSGTDALTVAAMALRIGPGDEVIVPSFSFVSTAVSFAARGAHVVFADVRADTLCIDPASVASLITEKTKAIVPVHYAGVGAEPDVLKSIADHADVALIEDAAHAIGARWNDQPLGTFGSVGVLSFDYAKNVQSGEGGAVLVADSELDAAIQIVINKGTNRAQFLAGQAEGYDWVDIGGHFRPPDYVAAALMSQLAQREEIRRVRDRTWTRYATGLAHWADAEGVRLPCEPPQALSSRHVFWMVFPTAALRASFSAHMADRGIDAPFHYTSLARSPAAIRFGRDEGTPVSDHLARGLARLPLHHALSDDDVEYVIRCAVEWSRGETRRS
jgi:dTDP-4-amino-4,6-dideoxygalactose transaminase